MKCFRRFSLIFFVVLIVLASFPFEAFAVDPVSALAIAGAMDAYGMAYGVGTVYDVTSNSGISDSFTDLWEQFSDYQTSNNHGLPSVNGVTVNYDDYIDEWQTNYKSLHGFSHSSGNFAAWSFDAESAQVFDQFWDWLLTGPAEMTRVDNEYFEFNQSQIGPDATPINVASFNSSPWASCLAPYVSSSVDSVIYSSSLPAWSQSNGSLFRVANKTPSTQLYVFYYDTGSAKYPVYVSPQSGTEYYVSYYATNGSYGHVYNSTTTQYSPTYNLYYKNPVGLNSSSVFSLPSYADLNSGLASLSSYLSNPSATSSDVGIIAYGDGVVVLPNPYGLDYTPVPLEIVTTVPWDSTYDPEDDLNGVPIPWTPSSVPGVVDDIADSISAEDYSIEADPNPDPDPDPNPGPGEVFLPFIPVGIPSFNFNLSGIWHYVREWVTSIGSWLTLMFTIWANLPYAIIVPVYASMVIVIVLGVYRRFFM